MRRILIVSPHFPPVNAPDHQRVRMLLPYLRNLGWEPTILAVRPEEVDGLPREPLLERRLPAALEVVRTGALPIALFHRIGMRTLALRSFPYLAQAGARLLRRQKFDLVFFSTTQFAVMSLGPRWRGRFGVPYVLDFQDPWISDYFDRRDGASAPGGRWKYGFSQWLSRRLEPRAVQGCAHAICVSPAYPETLHERYPQVETSRFSVLPFAADEGDFEIARLDEARQSVFDPSDGRRHLVYAGVVPPSFVPALRGFFRALARSFEADPTQRGRLMVHFVGTSYAASDRAICSVEPLARECGVSECVSEQPARIPYFQALRCLLDADALLLPGGDDATYTASKLFPCLFAQKPLLAIFHEDSSVVSTLRELGVEPIVTFRADTVPDVLADHILATRFLTAPESARRAKPSDLASHSAQAASVRLAEIFNRAAVDSAQAVSGPAPMVL